MVEMENTQELETPQDPISDFHKALISKGYKLPDVKTFRSGITDPERRKKLYNAMVNEGDYTKSYEAFDQQFFTSVPVKKKETSSPVSSPVAKQPTKPSSTTPTENSVEALKTTGAFGMTPDKTVMPVNLPKIETNDELEKERKQIEDDAAKLAMGVPFKGQVSNDMSGKGASSEIAYRKEVLAKKQFNALASEQTTKERYKKGEAVKNNNPTDWNFINQNFTGVDDKTKTAIAAHLNDLKLENPQRYKDVISKIYVGETSGEPVFDQSTGATLINPSTPIDLRMSPKEQVSFAQEAIAKRITEKKADIAIYQSRKQQGKGTVDAEHALSQADDIEKLTQDYNKTVELDPEGTAEAIQRKREKALNARKAKGEFGIMNQIEAQTTQSINGAVNAINEAYVSTINMANDIRKGSDHTYDYLDKTFDKFAEAADKIKGDDASDQKLSTSNVIPKTVKQIANMAQLFAGGELYGGGKIGLTLAGMTTQYRQYKEEGLQKGLSDETAMKFAFTQSFIQGALENISPNFGALAAKGGKSAIMDLLRSNPLATTKELVKHGFKQVVKENAQEFMQLTSDKAVNALTNQAIGQDKFDTRITADEALETFVLTTLATGAVTGATARAQLKGAQREQLNQLLENPEETAAQIDELVTEGQLTAEQGEEVKKGLNEAVKESKKKDDEPTTTEAVKEVDLETTTKAELLNEAPKYGQKTSLSQEQKQTPREVSIVDANKPQQQESSTPPLQENKTVEVQAQTPTPKNQTAKEESKGNNNGKKESFAGHVSHNGNTLIPSEKMVLGGTTYKLYLDEAKGVGTFEPLEHEASQALLIRERGTRINPMAEEIIGDAEGAKKITTIRKGELRKTKDGWEITKKMIISYDTAKARDKSSEVKPSAVKSNAAKEIESNTKSIKNDNTSESNLGGAKSAQGISNTKQEREVGNISKPNTAETPDQRKERVNRTILDAKVQKNTEKAIKGVLDNTKDAKLFDVLPKAEKAKARKVISDIYAEGKKNAPVTEVQPETPKKEVQKPETQLQKGQAVGSNNKNVKEFELTNIKEEIEKHLAEGDKIKDRKKNPNAFVPKEVKEFEPTNIKEQILQYIAEGGKINKSDFQAHHGKKGDENIGKKEINRWSVTWGGKDSGSHPTVDKLFGNETTDATEVANAFAEILQENSNRAKVQGAIKSEVLKRKNATEQTVSDTEIRSYEHAAELEKENDLQEKPKDLSEKEYSEYIEYANNVDDLKAQAESDKNLAEEHSKLFDRIINDPQYQKDDGSFDYDKLINNFDKGFDPDLLEIHDFELKNTRNEATGKSIAETVRKQQPERPVRTNAKNETKSDINPQDKQKGNRSGRKGGDEQVIGVNETLLNEQISAANKEAEKWQKKLGDRKSQRDALKRKAEKSLLKENQKGAFEQSKANDKLFDAPLSVGTKEKNIFTDFDRETESLQNEYNKALKEVERLENSRLFVRESDKAQTVIIFTNARSKGEQSNGEKGGNERGQVKEKAKKEQDWADGHSEKNSDTIGDYHKQQLIEQGLYEPPPTLEEIKDIANNVEADADKRITISRFIQSLLGGTFAAGDHSIIDFINRIEKGVLRPDFAKYNVAEAKNTIKILETLRLIRDNGFGNFSELYEYATKKGQGESKKKKKFTQASRGSRAAFVQKSIVDILNQVKKSFPNVEVISDQTEIDAIKAANPELAGDRGFVYEGKVYIDLALADPTTPLHEFAHVWVDLLEKVNTPQFNKAKELIQGTVYHTQAKAENPTKSANDLAKEAMVRAIEADAVRALSEGKVKQAVTKVKDWLRKFFNIPPTFNVSKITLEDFVRQANRELLKGTPLTQSSSLDIDNLLKNKSSNEFVVSNSVMSKRNLDGAAAKFIAYFREFMLLKGTKLGVPFQNRIRNAEAKEKAKVARYADLLRRWKIDLLSDARELSEADAADLMTREAEVFNGTRVIADLPPHRQKNMENLIQARKEIQRAFLDNMEVQGQVVINHDLNPLLTANYELQQNADNRLDEINKEYDALFERVKGLSEVTDNKQMTSIAIQLQERRGYAERAVLLARLNEVESAFNRISEKAADFSANKQDLLNKVRDLRNKIQKTQNSQGAKAEEITSEELSDGIKGIQKAIKAQEKTNEQATSKTDLNAKKRAEIESNRKAKADKIIKAEEARVKLREKDFDKKEALVKQKYKIQEDAAKRDFEKIEKQAAKDILTGDPKAVKEKFDKAETAHENRLAKINERKQAQLKIIGEEKAIEIREINDATSEKMETINAEADKLTEDYPDNRIGGLDPRLDTLKGEIEDLGNELAELLEKKKGSAKEQLLRDIDITRNVERKAELNKVKQKDTVEIRFKKKADGTFDMVFYQRDGTKVDAKGVTERDLRNMLGLVDSNIDKMIDNTEGYLPVSNPQVLLNNPLYEKVRKNDNYTRRSYMKYHETLNAKNIEEKIGKQAYDEGVKAIRKMYETAEMTAIRVKNTEGGEKVYVFLNESGVESAEMTIDQLDKKGEIDGFFQKIDVSDAQNSAFEEYVSKGGLGWFKFNGTKGRYAEHGVTFTLSKDQENQILNNFLANENKPLEGGVSSKKGLDTTMLKKRQNISPELRGLMGEYTDPIVVATRTIMDAAITQQKDKYHQMLLSEGMGTLFLTEPNERTGHTVKLSKNEMGTLEKMYDEKGNPISVLYTTEELYDGLLGSIKENKFVQFMQQTALSNVSGYVKAAFTIFGVEGRARDLVGNAIKLVETGNIAQFANFFKATTLANADLDRIDIKKSDFKNMRISHIAKEVITKGIPQSFNILDSVFRGAEAIRGNAYGNVENPTAESQLQELREADIFDGNIDVSAIAETSNALKGTSWLSQFAKNSAETYQKTDIRSKILCYWGEKGKMIERGMNEQDARAAAAANVRTLFQDYSLVPKFAKVLSVNPFVSNFIMFKTESFRTYTNGWKLAVSEIIEGQKNGNKVQVKQGAARLTSMSAGVGIRYALYKGLSHLVMSALGAAFDWDDDKDTEALRKLMPNYAKNSQFVVFGRDKNVVNMIDFSFFDPEGDIIKMAIAALRGGTIYEKFVGAGKEAISGYSDMDIALKTIANVLTNEDSYNNKIRNEQDDIFGDGGLDVLSYLSSVFMPKFGESALKVYNAAMLDALSEAQKPYGGVNTPTVTNQLSGIFLGVRVKKIDMAAMYKRSAQASDKDIEEGQRKFEGFDASKSELGRSIDFTKMYLTGETQNDKLKNNRDKSIKLVKDAFDDMLPKYEAAKQLGLDPAAPIRNKQLKSQLEAGQFTNPMFKSRSEERLKPNQ